MNIAFDDLEKQARALSIQEKATLDRLLIEELDMSGVADTEQSWIEEAIAGPSDQPVVCQSSLFMY